ncbi:ArsR/SmtB family transcription factor, partial [Streptomyces calidiresistens]
MLRIHFTDADLARTRVASRPDPLWEIVTSLYRLQTRSGRRGHAHWYRLARRRLVERGLARAVRTVLLPFFPRGVYLPDFLTPAESEHGLEEGLEAILACPPSRVRAETALLARTSPAPLPLRVDAPEPRRELVALMRAYHEAVLAPVEEELRAVVEAERSLRLRDLLDGGVGGMLTGLGPGTRLQGSVLSVRYPGADRDLRLAGRGLRIVPSRFCRDTPITLADPTLPPVLVHPPGNAAGNRGMTRGPGDGAPCGTGDHPWSGTRRGTDGAGDAPLAVLLGRTRAIALHAVETGATTGEIARAAGVSCSAASRHAGALRNAGLVNSNRCGTYVLHTLTPAGAALLRAASGERTPPDPPPHADGGGVRSP